MYLTKFVVMCLFILSISCNISASRDAKFTISPRVGINSMVGDMGNDLGMGYGGNLMFEYFLKEKFSLTFGLGYDAFPTFKGTTLYKIDYSSNEEIGYDLNVSDLPVILGVTYYIFDFRKKISPVLGLETGYIFITNEVKYEKEFFDLQSSSETMSLTFLAPVVGVTYPLNKDMLLYFKGRFMLSFLETVENDMYGSRNSSQLTNYNYWSIILGYTYIF